jgi:hypothetical protein
MAGTYHIKKGTRRQTYSRVLVVTCHESVSQMKKKSRENGNSIREKKFVLLVREFICCRAAKNARFKLVAGKLVACGGGGQQE